MDEVSRLMRWVYGLVISNVIAWCSIAWLWVMSVRRPFNERLRDELEFYAWVIAFVAFVVVFFFAAHRVRTQMDEAAARKAK